jgi:hypothetical protein
MTPFLNTVLRVWRLWDVLMNPYSHPVFNRVIRLGFALDFPQTRHAVQQLLRVVLWLSIIYIAWYDIRLLLFVVVLPIFIVLSLFTLPLFLPFIVVGYCTYLALRISQIISREKALKTYDLIRAVPQGALYVNWRIASGVLFGGETFEWLHMLVNILLKVIGIILLVLLGFVLFFSRSTPDFTLYIRTLIEAGSIIGIFATSYIQSIILAVIVGMHMPLFDFSEREGVIGTILAYLALQLTNCALLAIIFYYVHPALSGQSIWLDWLLPPLYWLLIVIWQSIVIEVLWQWLLYRLNASVDDLKHIG